MREKMKSCVLNLTTTYYNLKINQLQIRLNC